MKLNEWTFYSLNFQWLHANFGSIRDPLKQNLALRFCRNQNKENKGVIILTETHINLDQIHHIRNNSLDKKCSFPLRISSVNMSHTKGLLVLLHLALEVVPEVDIDPEGSFVSFKITLSSDRVLCVYALSRDSTRENLAFFWRATKSYRK